jgi:hypothetical protein
MRPSLCVPVRPSRRSLPRTALTLCLVAPALLAPTLLGTATAAHPARPAHPGDPTPAARRHVDDASALLAWQRTAMATIYPATPIPSGVPILGFTSMAMYDAASVSAHRRASSESAAVAAAAHDVLVHYLPTAQATLDAQLATSLATVPDGASEERGVRVGIRAAARIIERRSGDGYGDPTVHYTLPPGPGVWQPTAPATDMLVPWLGSLRPLVVHHPVHLDGPDPLSSTSYARDYDEVRLLGAATGSLRTPEQTATALFFNSNSATMVGDALVRHLEQAPMGLLPTARLFARMHAAMTDSIIECWQLKHDVGFWRPFQAIAAAGTDGNSRTLPQAGWSPLIPNPSYSEYVSGHAALTAPAVETIRLTLGEDTSLELRSVNGPPRVYADLGSIEYEAFHARIWGGLHFADAMDDGYALGHEMARRVQQALH